MKAEAITEKILADARAAAAQALKDARERGEQMRSKSDAFIEAEREKAMAQAKLDGVELRDRMLRMAELDQRKELLAMKREVIDQAFNRAIARMQDMDLPTARAYIEGLLLESAEGDEQIIISEQDEAIYDATFLKSVNEKLVLSGRPGRLSLSSERRDLRGGFVLTSGDVEVNCAFDAVVGQKRALLELSTANTLFQ